jgi:hypothetical protein
MRIPVDVRATGGSQVDAKPRKGKSQSNVYGGHWSRPSKRRAQKGQRSPRAEPGGGLLSRALAGAGERWEGVGKGRENEEGA